MQLKAHMLIFDQAFTESKCLCQNSRNKMKTESVANKSVVDPDQFWASRYGSQLFSTNDTLFLF